MNPSDIENAYTKLWLHFSTACHNANRTVRPMNSLGFSSRPTCKMTVVVKSLLYFPEWPYRAASRKRVDILLRSREEFACASDEMIGSSLQVAYFRILDGDALPLLALHYDFETPIKYAHPVFHVQLGSTDFTADERDAVGFEKTIRSPATPLYSGARIPTPYMNLGSVLLALAADHLPPKCYNDFLTGIKANPGVRWDATCQSLRNSLCTHGGYLHSHHWYA